MSKDLFTSKLTKTARVTREAREALSAIDWAALPETFRALGWHPTAEFERVLRNDPTESLEALLALRRQLAVVGDRARHSKGSRSKVIARMCSELVNLTGGALSLIDTR